MVLKCFEIFLIIAIDVLDYIFTVDAISVLSVQHVHPLTAMSEYRGSWRCDVCHESGAGQSWRCVQCNYCECVACHAKIGFKGLLCIEYDMCM